MQIGIDVGGTKIEGILLDDTGQEIRRERTPTFPGHYDSTVNTIVTLCKFLETKSNGPCTVGIGAPGSVSPINGLHRNANSTCLNNQNFRADIENFLGKEVQLANDANCFALSESVDGAGAGFNVVFGVILGTGVGGGIAINQTVRPGLNGIAGEWGHNPLPWPDTTDHHSVKCFCGQTNCIETFLSGPSLLRDYQSNGGTLHSVEAMAQSVSIDSAAEAALARYSRRLSRALAQIINVLDPDGIVLGGGLSNITSLYDTIPQELPDYVFSDACDTPIVRNQHGDSSGVRGAAWLGSRPENYE